LCATYSTAADFATYAVQQVVIEHNIVIGYEDNYGFISQASTASGTTHLGRAHGAGVYFYGNMSLDPEQYHLSILAASPTSNYVLRTDYPQRLWANMFINGSSRSGIADLVDRNDSQFATLFTNNCVSADLDTPSNFDQVETVDCATLPLNDYYDLSGNMTVDGDDHMNLENMRAFVQWMGVNPDDLADKNLLRFKPSANTSSGVTSASMTYAPLMNFGTLAGVDIEHHPLPATVYYGPFATLIDPGPGPYPRYMDQMRKR
jgi:hypothetical protein